MYKVYMYIDYIYLVIEVSFVLFNSCMMLHVWIYHNLFSDSSVGRYLAYFQFFTHYKQCCIIHSWAFVQGFIYSRFIEIKLPS